MTPLPRRIRLSLGSVVISLAAGVVVLLCGLLVNGCRISKLLSFSGTQGGSRTLITVTPQEVRDSAIAGANAMRVNTLAVVNSGGWLASSDDPWIHVLANNGGSRGTVRLSLDPKNLTEGLHEGSVTVQERESGGTSVIVPVNFLIQQPVLKVEPGAYTFTAHTSNSVFYDTLTVTNTGTGPLTWSVQTEHGSEWLTLGDTAGTAPGIIPLRASNEGLSYFGTFTETIIVTAPDAKNSPRRIVVTLKRRRHD